MMLAKVTSTEPEISRRSYLGWLIGLCTAGVGAVLSVPLIRFALYPLRMQTTEVKWSDAGPLSHFVSLAIPLRRSIQVEQVDGWRETVSEKVVYVTQTPDHQLQVLSAVCPHLGCSVQWSDAKQEFICPCHAASFGADGTKLSGPSPRAMDSLESRIENGRLLVRYRYFRQLVPTKEVIG
ncbi:MAG: Rieske (2Fe-2S) protein [Acidobacteriaceae bacterium]|nr:Rieske (2Fe-2S) protein [Acidobacteriaceae bacterium]MBV9038057.1 Rieske (2Fe-2S) protein [Acidobacteriaceae bacterium]MBV9223834.1 Rieske (2Fe-2S) protein [Acidobacteriaceae bacterium]MBV9308249.1 Rieske (2Fe-2S) protein [Acidobacteriaceae bacterium]MBV9939687.1 Rieske (2Fe-2S) protein [Acidobacteriaceae bacterium]